MKKLFFLGVFTTFFFFYIANGVAAHGEEASFEKETGGYLIDVGYDPEEFKQGGVTDFDFNLIQVGTKEDVEFSDIWVRISIENRAYFAGALAKTGIGRTTLKYVFPVDGDYELSVRFENEGEILSETSFPLSVQKVQGSVSSNNLLIGGLSGFILGVVLTLALTKKKGKKSNEK